MNLNGRGQAAMGIGAGPGSVDGRIVAAPGGGLCFVDDDRVVLQTEIGGQWLVILVRLSTGDVETPAPPRAANALAAGGGRWIAWLAGTGVYGSIERPDAGLIAAGPDGTLAYCPSYASGVGIVLNAPDGTETVIPDGMVIDRQLQVLGPAAALWLDFHGGLRVYGDVRRLRPALTPGRTRLVTIDGEDWLVYQSDRGLVAQLDGAADGYVLEPRPITFNHDARNIDGALVVAWSTTQGEGPGDLVKVTVDWSQPRVLLVKIAATPVDVPRIGKPCLVGWFTDRQTDAPGHADLWVDFHSTNPNPPAALGRRRDTGEAIAQYVAGSPDGDLDALNARIGAARAAAPDLPVIAYWTRGVQAIGLPDPWALPGVELYWRVDESIAALELRGRQSVARCGACVLIVQAYSSNASQSADLGPIVAVAARIARDAVNVLGVFFFSAGSRATGYNDHPDVHPFYAALFAGVDGVAELPSSVLRPPVAPAPRPPSPHPVPAPPLAPPVPVLDSFTLREVHMVGKTLGLVGPGGQYARINPSATTFVFFDRTAVGADEQFEAVPQPNDTRYVLRHKASGVILSADNTVHGSQLVAAQFSTRPAGTAPGNYELWTIKRDPDSGLVLAFVRYTEQGAEAERKFAGGLLSVIEQ